VLESMLMEWNESAEEWSRTHTNATTSRCETCYCTSSVLGEPRQVSLWSLYYVKAADVSFLLGSLFSTNVRLFRKRLSNYFDTDLNCILCDIWE